MSFILLKLYYDSNNPN